VDSVVRDVIPVVVSQHAEEAAFLWLLRSDAVRQPHYSLEDLTRLDCRVEAHLDGLRVAGDAGWKTVQEGLAIGEPGEIFAAGVLAFATGEQAHIQAVLDVAGATRERCCAIIAALGWLPLERVAPWIVRMLGDQSPALRRIGLAAMAIHRRDPGPAVTKALVDDDLPLRARGLRAVGELGRPELLPFVERHLTAEDYEVRFSAAWSAAVLSSEPEPLSALARIAQSDGRHRDDALEIVARRAELGAARNWLRMLARDVETLQLAVRAAGFIGDPAEIPWLIEQMRSPELARAAGEAFSTITGVDIAYEKLEGERPEGFESGPTEDPNDLDVEPDPQENLPWPSHILIQNWWQANRHELQPGNRYLMGKPITIDWCKQVLRTGRQRQRAAAALELAMRRRGSPLFEVRSPGFRQVKVLGL
jgi:uncharacterized protein (TIGR02270 family)